MEALTRGLTPAMRKHIERTIVRTVVTDLLLQGFVLRVADDEINCTDTATVCSRMFHNPEEALLVKRGSNVLGKIEFVYGLGIDVMVGYNKELNRWMAPINRKLNAMRKEWN